MEPVELNVPCFARLTDYIGLWSMEPEAFATLCRFAGYIDLKAHVDQPPEALRSALEFQSAPNGKKIAIVKLTGLLMKGQSSFGGTSSVQARRDIRQAAADSEVAGILLAIDSPGGTVAGTHDLANEVKAARREKPVWAHIEDLGASAAYWVASQAEHITANSPTAMVGSIGTMQLIHDHSVAAEKAGIRTLLFATGPLKGLGSLGTKITEDQANHMQGLVDEVQKSFDSGVKSGRGLTDKQLAAVRHGGVMTAHAAVEHKLIDAVQPMSKTMAQFQAALRNGPQAYQASLEALLESEFGIDLASGEIVAFTHNSQTSASEPDWGSVDKTALPRMAFADRGEPDQKSTWGYPHHWVQNAGGKDGNGIWTSGTLLLHRGGLNAAWSAAQGGRSGQKASQPVIDHLQAHRKALGLDQNASSSLPMLRLAGLPELKAQGGAV